MSRTTILLFLVVFSDSCLCYDYSNYPSPRTVETKQGIVQGTIKTLRNLDPVEVYLGIPYAAAPVGTKRFMPPSSPPPWSGTRLANSFGPVCPQNFPLKPAVTVPTGRWAYIDRVKQVLSNQSEDCLYLNIYVPVRDGGHSLWDKPTAQNLLPVIVFVHGESFEWNSGNLYDGSVLASYGKVIVVTLNFRLGILGFLKPGVSPHVPTNFGLCDQVAALEWVRGNIGQFGGDPRSVTLMGQGTGAACVSYLMISPLVQAEGSRGGLFKRAILMSGTALSDWALTSSPVHVTLQVAQALNCPDSEDHMAECLRKKRLHELMAVRVHVPPFKTTFGPVVDSQVIPNEPALSMGQYNSLFQQYDLLCGITELESYNLVDDIDLNQGVNENDFFDKLKDYFNAKFEKLPEVARAKTIMYYRTWENPGHLSAAFSHRNTLLDILSDARVAAPMVQTADYHSQANPRSYFYLFKHLTKYGDFHPSVRKSVQGEELPYVFGVPLGAQGVYLENNFSPQEKLLSEVVMTLWTNFAKTGNPNAPRRLNFLSQSHYEWRQYDLEWPEYNTLTQKYYSIDIPPSIEQYYRQDKLAFWNRDLPLSLNNTSMPYQPTQTPWLSPSDPRHQDLLDINHEPHIPPPVEFDPRTYPPEVQVKIPSVDEGDSRKRLSAVASSVTLSVVILVGMCFALINLCAFAGLYYQRDKLRVRERLVNTRYRCVNVASDDADPDDQYRRSEPHLDSVDGSSQGIKKNQGIKSILKSSEGGTYEQVNPMSGKTASVGRPGTRLGVSRDASSSTVTIDPHTKVKEWIAHEIVHRCSPNFLRRCKKVDTKTSSFDTFGEQGDQLSTLTFDSNNSRVGSINTNQRQKPKKVSVAVDATPASRSSRVLQQTPIELTKSMDEGLVVSGKSSRPYHQGMKAATSLVTILKRPSLQRSEALGSEESTIEPLRRSTSINVQLSSTTPSSPSIMHVHTQSDPLSRTKYVDNKTPENKLCEDLYSQVKKRPKETSLIPVRGKPPDINVTSRDDLTDHSEMSAEEALDSIKRRNCPRVLPDYPEESFHLQKATKRRSLPLSAQLTTDTGESDESTYAILGLKVPPPPPPRMSTLGRKPTNASPVISLNTSQLSAKLKPSDKTQVPLAVRVPTVPTLPASVRPLADIPESPPKSQIKRNEPRIIIRPTMNPIMGKSDPKTFYSSSIPRVTPPQPKEVSVKEYPTSPLLTCPSKAPDISNMGIGKPTKVPPVKKTVSTETITDCGALNTSTVRRHKK